MRTEKQVTNMKNIQVLVIMVGLLLTASAVGAVNYPTYKPTYTSVATAAPQEQTTSTSPSDLTPMLNEDGSAVNPYAGVSSRPRRDREDEGQAGTAGDPTTPPNPIGSVWVLLIFAIGYAGVVAMRKRRSLTIDY